MKRGPKAKPESRKCDRLCVRLTKKDHAELKLISKYSGMPMSDILRLGVNEALADIIESNARDNDGYLIREKFLEEYSKLEEG